MQKASRKKSNKFLAAFAIAAGLFFAVVLQGIVARLVAAPVVPNIMFAYAGLLMAFPFSGLMRFSIAGIFIILHPLTTPFAAYLAVFAAGSLAAWYLARRHFDEGSFAGALVSVLCFTAAFYTFRAAAFAFEGEGAKAIGLAPAFAIELALNLAVTALLFMIFSRGMRAATNAA